MDYADARRRMVDGQLRPNRVTDPRLLDAIRTLPREAFLPPALRSRAYLDEDVPLPGGRALLEPMVLARMLQLAAVRPDDRALVVCAGVGYGAAVLARMGARVVAVEDDAALRALAQAAFPVCGLAPGAVRLEGGAPAGGFPAASPYDAILVEGEVPEIPQALAAQLAEGGRLVAAQGGATGGRAVLGRLLGGAFTVTPAFDCAVPALPAFAPAPGFVF